MGEASKVENTINGGEKIFEEIMIENLPNLGEEIDPHVQETEF